MCGHGALYLGVLHLFALYLGAMFVVALAVGILLFVLADILPELIRLEVNEISLDRDADHGLAINKSRFASFLPRF